MDFEPVTCLILELSLPSFGNIQYLPTGRLVYHCIMDYRVNQLLAPTQNAFKPYEWQNGEME